MGIKMENEKLKEAIADQCHQQWTHWMQYLLSRCHAVDLTDTETLIIPAIETKRWKKQINIPYNCLSEEEKASDREQADKIIKGMEEFIDKIEF